MSLRADLTYPPEAEAFREEIRRWLEENLPGGRDGQGHPHGGAERRL